MHDALLAQNQWPWLGMLMLAGIMWKRISTDARVRRDGRAAH